LDSLTPALFGAAIAFSATPPLRWVARRAGFLDQPGPRSSHLTITPRGGGVAILLGTAGGAALATSSLPAEPGGTAFLGGLGVLVLMGLWDDRFGLPALAKLAAQLLAAGLLVAVAGGFEQLPLPPPLDLPLGPLAEPVALLWLLVVVNAYNFLDGIDGLAALQGLVSGAGLGVLLGGDTTAAIGLGLAGGCAGFLPWNWSRASIFMGDVGSNTLGYTLAALPLLLPHGRREDAVLVLLLSSWLFIADAVWTRLRRMARGGRWYAAHREHLYQRLVATGLGHAPVALAIGAGSTLLTLVALLSPGRWTAIVLAAGAFAALAGWTRWRESHA
jgi:UDP-N-acetylmuramyl pentapeptide phosphotransferase/UDP-N-acetylglucosamine-1-phosphate transferase